MSLKILLRYIASMFIDLKNDIRNDFGTNKVHPRIDEIRTTCYCVLGNLIYLIHLKLLDISTDELKL